MKDLLKRIIAEFEDRELSTLDVQKISRLISEAKDYHPVVFIDDLYFTQQYELIEDCLGIKVMKRVQHEPLTHGGSN